MIVKSLSVANFRNYQQEKIEFSENTNVIYGNNAQGKTNLLESIYYLAAGNNFRGNKDIELIKWDYIFLRSFSSCILGSKKRSCYIFLKAQKLSQKFFSTLSKKSENDNFGQHF